MVLARLRVQGALDLWGPIMVTRDRPAISVLLPSAMVLMVMMYAPMMPVRRAVEMRDEHRAGRPWVPVHRAVMRPPPRSIHDVGVVVGHVHVLGARIDDDRIVLLVNGLLLSAPEIAVRLRAPAQVLHCVHHLRLLGNESLAQVVHPLRTLAHAREQIGVRLQRPDGGIPRLTSRNARRGQENL